MTALRDRTRRKRRRAAAYAKLALASCAALGIGAGVTTAAWVDDVRFSATATAQAFRMQYSFTNAPDSWLDFPDDGVLTLSGVPEWMDPNTGSSTHSIFVRNAGGSTTSVSVAPVIAGAFTDAGVVTVNAGINNGAMSVVANNSTHAVLIAPAGEPARVDISIVPSALQQSTTTRAADLTVTVTGTVGAQQGGGS